MTGNNHNHQPKSIDQTARLSKIMASRGMCSRREAEEYIKNGWVLVNNSKIDKLGIKFPIDCQIKITKEAKLNQQKLKSIILHKPIGYVSSQPESNNQPAIKLINVDNYFPNLAGKTIHAQTINQALINSAVAGRLDIDSSGLLVFTQDGRVAKKIIGEDSKVEKEYLVRVSQLPNQYQLQKLQFGLSLDGIPLKPAIVNIINPNQIKFILTQGRKRQIRRMNELVGIKTLGIKRVRIGNIKLANLPYGKWRFLTAKEVF